MADLMASHSSCSKRVCVPSLMHVICFALVFAVGYCLLSLFQISEQVHVVWMRAIAYCYAPAILLALLLKKSGKASLPAVPAAVFAMVWGIGFGLSALGTLMNAYTIVGGCAFFLGFLASRNNKD